VRAAFQANSYLLVEKAAKYEPTARFCNRFPLSPEACSDNGKRK
jgi:hypothetical protein